MRQVAEEEDRKLSPKGAHVYYISDFYTKSHEDFEEYSYEHQIPIGSHAGAGGKARVAYERKEKPGVRRVKPACCRG